MVSQGSEEAAASQFEAQPLQDYLIHYVVRRAIGHGQPIQIHTGHHEPSVTRSGNLITNSKVSDLVPLLLENPKARFVLLHGGYPYSDEYLSIVKNFPNAYADLAWLYVISPAVSEQLLHRLIDMVPQAKIIGFGGDYHHVEGAYAHARMARNTVYSVLRARVDNKDMQEAEARRFADLIFRDNPLELYRLGQS